MIPAAGLTNLPVEDFSGGLRTTGGFYARVPTSPRCQNVYSLMDKLLRIRPGFGTESIPADTEEVYGLYEYKLSSIDSKQLVHFGTTIKYMDNFDKTWTTLQTGLSSATSEFETFQTATGKILLHCTHNNDTLKSWNGTDASMTVLAGNGAPRPKYIRVWNNHVFAAGISDHESRLRWSNLATYDQWQTNSVDNYDDNCQTGDGDFITGLATLRGNLYVFKRYSIFRLTYLGGSPLFSVLKVVDGTGCISSKSICYAKIPQTALDGTVSKQEVLIFLTPDKKVVAFDGSYIYPLTDAVYEDNAYSPVCMKTMNDGLLNEAHAIYYEPDNLYILFYAHGNSSSINRAWCINMQTKGVWPWSNMSFRASGLWTGVSNVKMPYVGDNSGNVYRFLYGSKDDATAITAYYETDLIDAKRPDVVKKGRNLTLYIRPRSNATITVSRATGWQPTFREERSYVYTEGHPLGSFVLGSSYIGTDFGSGLHYDVPESTGQLRFRIYSSSTLDSWELHRLDFTEGSQSLGPNAWAGVTVS